MVVWRIELQVKYDEAEALYRRAKDITEVALGKRHLEYSVRLHNLAGLLMKRVGGSESFERNHGFLVHMQGLGWTDVAV